MNFILAIVFTVANPFYSISPDIHLDSGEPWNIEICLFSQQQSASVNYEMMETFYKTHQPGVSKTKDGKHEFKWTQIWDNRLSEVIEEEIGKIDGKRLITFKYSYRPGLFVVACERSSGFFRPLFISNEGEDYHCEILDESTVRATTFLLGTHGYDTVDDYKLSGGVFFHSSVTAKPQLLDAPGKNYGEMKSE